MEVLINEWWSQIIKERKCSNTNKVVKAILSCPRVEQEQAYKFITKHIKDSILEARKAKNIKKTFDLCVAINGCFDNFSYAADSVNLVFNEVINFIDVTIDDCKKMLPIRDNVQMRKVKWLELIHYLARILVLVLKQRRPLKLKRTHRIVPGLTSFDKKPLLRLSHKLSYFFKVKEILMDTKCALAMASLLIREILVEDQAKLIEYHNSFLETLLPTVEEDDCELNVYKFLLGNAILNTWSGILIDETSTEIYLRFFIQLCERYSSDTGIILNISRALLLLIKNDSFTEFMNNMYREEFDLVNPLLSCVYMLLDHPVPCVRHSSKDLPKLLARHKEFQISMMQSLPGMITDNRSYFICISALANAPGPQPNNLVIIDNEAIKENLFVALRDPSLVTYVIDALNAIILRDHLTEKNFPVWCERWIVPLLFCLHKVRPTASPEIEKLLQSLLVKSPKTISFIVSKWHTPKNDEELRYIMTALKVYNKLGLKHREESCLALTTRPPPDSLRREEEKWKDIISKNLLLRCLNHSDDDVRVSAFALVVETLKSTEIYTTEDFELIKYALKYNLNNQQPATRQKFLSLVRKMMTRFVDSLAVAEKLIATDSNCEMDRIKRNYRLFREWLLDFSFSNIYHNANFNRLHTILSILLDYVEIIKEATISYSSIDNYFMRLLVPIRSSYEENKKMAVLLTKKLKVLELYKNTQIIRTMFKNAFELCGKIEPPNVLTGAYTLQLLLQYLSLDKALRRYSEGISYCSMEHLVVTLLSKKLEDQIRCAEKNLIQAVTDNSMYGTLFAIRLILQETDFSQLTDNPESENRTEIQRCWSEALMKLIEFSFRMIKVVSCVVNSSSPEGHLPSDFQTNLDLVCQNCQNIRDIQDFQDFQDFQDIPDFQHIPDFQDIPGFQDIQDSQADRSSEEGAAARNLKRTTPTIQKIDLCKAPLPRTRSVMFQDCDRILTYYNNVFLALGESRSFTEKNAMVFEHILTETTRLISDLETIEEPSDEETKCLSCLRTVETRVKNYIALHEDNKRRRGKPTAQMLLLCSWRSIKEACLFLGDLVEKLPVKKLIESELLPEVVVVTMAVELRKLLCEIKHRGAFEHAYVGFTSLVSAFWKCPMKDLNELPQKWLEEILCEIQQPVEDQKIKFCSNRRSAGLPFLVQAIICSELKCTNSAKIHTLDMTMNTLLAVADDDSGTDESIIHSLNILRALFKHALLGEHVAPYVCQGVVIAIKGSRSPTWGIRNSACLLFSALMIRIFGVARDKDLLSKKNRMTAKHFFQRYPELYQFFLNEMDLEFDSDLQSFQPITTIPSPKPHLFLILLILGRLYSSPVEDKAGIDFSEFFPYIKDSCCNATLKIRELGARALIPLIGSDTFIEALENRFFTLKSQFGENNLLQGTLFQIKNILLEMCDKKKLYEEALRERVNSWIGDSHPILDLIQNRTPFMIKIVYVQILHLLFKIDNNVAEKLYELLNVKDITGIVGENSEIWDQTPGGSIYLENLHFVRFDIAAHICTVSGNRDYMMRSFFSMLNSSVEEVQIVGLAFLKFITSTRYDDLPDEEESNLISVKLRDMICVQDDKKLSLISREIFSHQGVINHVMESFVTLLNNANNPDYLYNMTTRLKLSVISNFVLRSLISVHNIYRVCSPTAIPGPLLDLLSEIIECHSSEISVGAFICFGVIFFENIKTGIPLTSRTVLYFRRLLFSYSGADADVKQKIAVCEIFNKYYYMFIHRFFKADNQAMSIWMLPVRLLSDEDPRVRRRIMEMVSKYQDFCRENNQYKTETIKWEFEDVYFSQITGTPYKAQETLVECYISLLDREDLIHLFVPMVAFMLSAYINTMNREFTTKQNEDGVFEKGNPNPFCEDMTFGKLLCKKLKQFSMFMRILFSRQLDPTHIDSLKEFFPSLVLVNFPDTLLEFCTQIVKALLEEYSEGDLTCVSFLPFYIGDLMELWDM